MGMPSKYGMPHNKIFSEDFFCLNTSLIFVSEVSDELPRNAC